jgi:CubicO group peptidase (beta-lactamase class C family)
VNSATARFDRRGILAGGLAAGASSLLLPGLAQAQAAPASFPRLTALLEKWVGPGKFPGIVAGVGLPGRDPQFVVRGTEGNGDTDPITPDSLFRIYSMTKPVTGVAAMMLVDEGKLGLDQPLSDILPKFAKMNVQVTPDGSVTDLRPARNPILIRNLMTHTAGLGYSIIQRGPIKALMEERGVVAGQITKLPVPVPGFDRGKAVPSLALFADRLADIPLVHEPGTTWSYSMGLDLLGRVIEVVSGRPFEVFLQERLFGPAGMTSTWFQVPASEARRLTTNYVLAGQTFLPIDPSATSIYLDKPPFPFGGAGLVSTPRDYDRFLRMLAQYGRIDGRRLMSEPAVRVATSNLLPDGVDMKMMAMMGQGASGFGAGGRIGLGPEAGIFGWAGAAGTVGTVDMRRGIRSSIFLQFMPPNGLPVLTEYQQALQADLAALAARAA